MSAEVQNIAAADNNSNPLQNSLNKSSQTLSPSKNLIESKVVLLGDTGVGKTSIAMRFAENQFNLRTNSSVGASFISRSLQVDDVSVKLRLWDTAGQERFRALAPMYYRGAAAAVLCYDITSKSSFDKVITWVEELQRNIQGEILLTIVGNKSDRAKYRQIELSDGETYAKSVGAKFFEVSAKTGDGIEEAFFEIAKELRHTNPEPLVDEDLKKNMNPHVEENYFSSNPIVLENTSTSRAADGKSKQEKSSGCCA
eukprot:TRINITY_DN1896_c0_g1_i2.p1 TRINITY_DN1896_c0_g1~~TRINITY_DN1896_c0_g1_i2.p1  ORF type:complete len:255 (-),score=30.73 TRINITY_DN1896_c0_g1_i2:78-842(-)